MVHIDPLPGSPGYAGSMTQVVEHAIHDARLLAEAGFPALMIENFGDVPFFPDRVPAITIAAMSRVATEVRAAADLPLGINVLRNDGTAAVAIAAAVGASLVRVNVLSGTMFTDQGLITGRAAEVARDRSTLAPEVAVLADVFVKHAAPPPGLTIEQAAVDTWERAGADALVLSGSGTGMATDLAAARRVRSTVPDAPLVVGSGTTPDTLADIAEIFDSAIVGTALKFEGRATNRVDPDRAAALMDSARRVGWA